MQWKTSASWETTWQGTPIARPTDSYDASNHCQLIVQETRGKISSDDFLTVDLEAELPTTMKEAMTRKEGYVFKVRVVGGRKKEGTGGLALKIISIV